MITKRVKKNNMVSALAVSVIFGVLTEGLFLLVILATGSWSRLWQSVLVALCLTAVYLIIGWIRASFRNHRFTKNLKKQNDNGIPLDEDAFEQVTKHVSLGRNWLVYHKGNTVVPVSISSIQTVRTDGKHAVLLDEEQKPVYVLKYGHREAGLPDKIREWLHVNKNSEYR